MAGGCSRQQTCSRYQRGRGAEASRASAAVHDQTLAPTSDRNGSGGGSGGERVPAARRRLGQQQTDQQRQHPAGQDGGEDERQAEAPGLDRGPEAGQRADRRGDVLAGAGGAGRRAASVVACGRAAGPPSSRPGATCGSGTAEGGEALEAAEACRRPAAAALRRCPSRPWRPGRARRRTATRRRVGAASGVPAGAGLRVAAGTGTGGAALVGRGPRSARGAGRLAPSTTTVPVNVSSPAPR